MTALLDSFLLRALLGALGTALAAAPLGCFVVWRRMAYFGDATAHATILGVAFALALSLPVFLGALVTAVLMALGILALRGHDRSDDTLLGVLSHAALALGVVAVSFIPNLRVDLTSFLFGDILSVSPTDLAIIWTGGALVTGLVYWRWDALLTATLSPGLAHASGIDPRREEVVYTIALAIVVAVSIKVVGALLIGALLVIPAAAARPLAKTPERMAIVAALIGAASVILGLAIAWVFDTPAGPSIVCAAAALFLATAAVSRTSPPSSPVRR